MCLAIANGSARVLVCDPSESVRMEVVAVLRSLGFTQVSPARDIADARSQLRLGAVDWIITSLFATGENSAFDLLRLLPRDGSHPVTVSFLVDQSEMQTLPSAFEVGLASWHPKPFTRTTLRGDLEALIKSSVAAAGDLSLAAAPFLRTALQALNQSKSRIRFEEALIDRYFGKPELLLELAEARLLAGERETGAATLRQARFFDRTLEARALGMMQRFNIEPDTRTDSQGNLPIESCLIVDPDSIVLSQVEGFLKRLGVRTVSKFTDGASAWDAVRLQAPPQLIIQEWHLPTLNGPAFLQRLRSQGHQDIPVVVLSSLLSPADGPLLVEMSVSNSVAKPVTFEALSTAIRWTVVQERMPTDVKALERKMIKLLRTGRPKEAEALRPAYFANPRLSTGERKYMEAEMLYSQGAFDRCRTTAIESIKLIGKGSLAPLNLLGRCLLKLGDFEAAGRILEQAHKLSPQNLGRILDLAELKLLKHDGEGAQALVEDARKIDPTSPRVASVDARVSIVTKQTKKAHALLSKMEALADVVSYMNNRAVALAKAGRFGDSTGLYRDTLASLPDERLDLKAIVSYNLALCHARNREYSQALAALAAVARSQLTPQLGSRVDSLKGRLAETLETGKPFVLHERPDQGAKEEQKDASLESLFETIGSETIVLDDNATIQAKAKASDQVYALEGIFSNSEPVPDAVAALWEKGLRKAS